MRSVWDEEPDWEQSIWRYLKTERFVSMIEDSRVYFAAATEFTDPFEGAVAVMHPDSQVDSRYEEIDGFEEVFRELKRLTKINCWHRADYESDAMWKLYAGLGKGVAVCSTPGRMREAFQPFRLKPDYGVESLWCGDVHYEDLLIVRMNPGMRDQFFVKHMAFSSEREFRLAISLESPEEFGVKVPESGIQVTVDISTLVERIVLGPKLCTTDLDLIVSHAEKAGLGDRVCKSSLLGRPRYV